MAVSTSGPAVVIDIVCKPSFDQRLIGHIPLVGFDFDPIKESFGQAE
jgi:hypothetical protein